MQHDLEAAPEPDETTPCISCDPQSKVPHSIKVTRLRIANLCCAGEERIIKTTLNAMIGIEEVAVNVVGRYAIVKHCGVSCCAPADTIVTKLNEQRLGASIQEANSSPDDEEDERMDYSQVLHDFIVTFLFILAVIFDSLPEEQYDDTISMIVYLVCIGIGLIPVVYAAWISLSRGLIDIHLLMMVAVAGAIGSQEYLDAALVLVLFINAQVIEAEVMRQVRLAIRITAGRMGTTATLVSGETIKVDTIQIGQIIAVRAGEIIMCDGVVSNGQGVVDESALTGEAVPIGKVAGDKVVSGGVVQNGYLEITVSTAPQDSTLRKLNQAVSDVQADRGEFAKVVDSFAFYWTPLVIIAAAVLTVIGGAVSDDWHVWVHRSLVLLVLACPCSIVIAAPIPSVCAIATAAKHGVLIKGSSVVENVGTANALAVDKTGTLTKGFFAVSSFVVLPDDPDDPREYDPLALAAALESKSAHPLANAVVSAYCGCIAEYEGELATVKQVKMVEGVGLDGWVEVQNDWKHIAVGNERLLKAHGGKLRPNKKQQALIDEYMAQNADKLTLLVVIDDNVDMIISLSDQIRFDAASMIGTMKRLNFAVSMLTGDHQKVAMDVCMVAGIADKDCHARLLPNEKLDWIRAEQKRGHGVIMLGDGINDAAALAAAKVGVAMGAGGSAMAAQAADVVIMSENLLRLPSCVQLCRDARNVIIQNCVFSIVIKLAAIVMAILGMLSLWQAVLIDVGSLLVVVGNGSVVLFNGSFSSSDAPEEPNRKQVIDKVTYVPFHPCRH